MRRVRAERLWWPALSSIREIPFCLSLLMLLRRISVRGNEGLMILATILQIPLLKSSVHTILDKLGVASTYTAMFILQAVLLPYSHLQFAFGGGKGSSVHCNTHPTTRKVWSGL